MIQIVTTKPGDANFHLFENVVHQVYTADKASKMNGSGLNKEFLHSCFVLLDKGIPKARLALYINPNLMFNDKKAACIGNYECVEDDDLSNRIITIAKEEAKKLGMPYLIGPMNGSTWDNYRFSVHNHHENFLGEPYHHAYYNQHFTQAGFDVISEYYSNFDDQLPIKNAHVLALEKHFETLGVKIRSINMDDYEAELALLYPFLSEAFKRNFLYTPISWSSFRVKYLEVAKIINPNYVFLAEDKDGKIIGFMFSYMDLLNSKAKTMIVKTIARHTDKQYTGLGKVLGLKVIEQAKEEGFDFVIHAFIKKDGTSIQLSETYLGREHKNYRLYGMEL